MRGALYIEGLKLETSIGVYEEEKRKKQILLLDLTMSVDFSKAIATDRIEDTVNYEELKALCEKVTGERHYHLIEHLAALLLQELEREFAPLGIKVVLKKESALPGASFAAVIYQKGVVLH